VNRYSVVPKYEYPECIPASITVQRKRRTYGNLIPGTTTRDKWWYSFDSKHLTSAVYYDKGNLIEEHTYKYGILHSVKRYNVAGDTTHIEVSESGFARRAITLRDDKPHGTYREWHYNGKLFLEATFKKGKLHGIIKVFSDEGKLHEKCRFVRGEPHGHYLVCHSGGSPKASYTFRKGKQHGWAYLWNEAGGLTIRGCVADGQVFDCQGDYKKVKRLKNLPLGGVIKTFGSYAALLLHSSLARRMYTIPLYYAITGDLISDGQDVSQVI
jgi:hypothetical protein